MTWELESIASAVDGLASGTAVIECVDTDSRRIRPGSLFVALVGEKFDGHHFVEPALDAGAGAVMVNAGYGEVAPRIEVRDTGQALIDFAAWERSGFGGRVVAVTGSTGKTSTKDLLAGALAGDVWASPMSFNNEIGVPLTVLERPREVGRLVVEVGSRGVGHIRRLIPAIRPHVAVVTGVGHSHLEMLGDVETVRKAKWELVEGLEPGGVAILPAADSILLDWAQRAGVDVVTFGSEPGADVRAADVSLDDRVRPAFRLFVGNVAHEVKLEMAGSHQAVNAAAAVAAAVAVGADIDEILAGIESASGSPWRMAVTSGRFTLINDAYNANPASMAAALEAASELSGRKLAVLGQMAELGAAAPRLHEQAGELAASLGFHRVYVIGEDPGIARGAGDIAVPVDDLKSAAGIIRPEIEDGDIVLLKASRSVGLEALAGELQP